MAKDAQWKRVLAGVIGLAVVVVLLLIARDRGVTGGQAQRWEELFVFSAVAAAGIVWLLRRRYRRPR